LLAYVDSYYTSEDQNYFQSFIEPLRCNYIKGLNGRIKIYLYTWTLECIRDFDKLELMIEKAIDL
jgi:hypothetical protein